ncbi:MAG: HK97 gp10 family phage protein [Pilosibacter sp.]
MRDTKKNTPVRTGYLRKSWRSAPAVKGPSGVKKVVVNTADYSEFVNYGHRVVSRSGKTTGFVPGHHMLEKGVSYIDRRLMGLFKAEIERIRREHDG